MKKKKQDVLDALGLETMEQHEQEELLLDLNSLVFKGSLVRLIENMDEKTKEDFNDFLDTSPDEDHLIAFMVKHVPDADEILAQTLADIQNDILSVTGKK
jgi:hypothetical protein